MTKLELIKPESLQNWYNNINKSTYHICLTDGGNVDKLPFFYQNSQIITHWINWANVFLKHDPQNFFIKIGHGQGLSSSNYITQLQSVLGEVFNVQKDWLENEMPSKSFRLQISHEWCSGNYNNDLIKEYRNIAKMYSSNNLIFSINIVLDLLELEAKGIDYKELREFFRENAKNNLFNIVTIKNLHFIGSQTKKMLNILSGFLKDHFIMNIFLSLHYSNLHSGFKGESTDYLNFFKFVKSFCPKGFMEMLMPEMMDFQRDIKNGPTEERLESIVLKQIEEMILSGIIINSSTGMISPIVNGNYDDYSLLEGFSHVELMPLPFEDVYARFKSQAVKKLISSHCSNCSSLSICVKEKIWWLNTVKQTDHCALGLKSYIKASANKNILG